MSGRIYVVGASGYVGSAVASCLGTTAASVVGTHCSGPSVHSRTGFDFWTDDPGELLPADGVVFAAHVEGFERPVERFERRVDALTRACSDCRFVYLSSDAVFDGEDGPYTEDAPTRPQTAYGRRTAQFEERVRDNCSDFCIVRPSYVYGYAGGVLDDRLRVTFRALRSGERPEYFDDMYRSPVEVNRLARVVRRAYESDFVGTLHAGGPRMSVYEFHCRAVAAFGGPADRIERDSMPPDSPHTADTSLDSSLAERELGISPAGVTECLLGGPADSLP